MRDGRRRRIAKQARRDARRRKKLVPETPPEPHTADAARPVLDPERPLQMLYWASMLIQTTRPEPFSTLKTEQGRSLEDSITDIITNHGSTAALATLAELLDDEPALQTRCRREVARRSDPLPQWLTEIASLEVYRAARRTHVLGDGCDIVLGGRFADGQELTCGVSIDHNLLSSINDAAASADPIDKVLARVAEIDSDPDAHVVDMSLADARAWIEHGLGLPALTRESRTWPATRPLVRWLIRHLPEGGAKYLPPAFDWDSTSELCERFFASSAGTQFKAYDHEDLLIDLLESGSGDPLRWSAARIRHVLGYWEPYGGHISVRSALDAPALLRAFIPFAHAQSGIRDELTAQALVAIDEMESSYRQYILGRAVWDDDVA
ncbi:hypothetical protein [Mycolicibacterium thermoresistibile]